jgi:hypothetical protein
MTDQALVNSFLPIDPIVIAGTTNILFTPIVTFVPPPPPPLGIDIAIRDGSRLVGLVAFLLFTFVQVKFHTPLDHLPLPYHVYPRGRLDDRRTGRVHERGTPAGQARGI